MSLFHALFLFFFGTRVLYGLPSPIYYQAEALAILAFLIKAALTRASWINHYKFFGVVVLIFVAVSMSAVMASITFDQPFIYGFMTRRELFVAVIPAYYLCYHAHKSLIVNVVYKLAFFLKIYIFGTLLLSAFIEPQLVKEALAFDDDLRLYLVDYSVSLADYRFKFSPFPGFLFLVYFFSQTTRHTSDKLALAAFLFWLLAFYGGRVTSLTVFLFLLTVYFTSVRTNASVLRLLIALSLSPTLFFLSAPILDSEAVASRVDGLYQALAIASNASESVVDSSVLSRMSQFNAVNEKLDYMDFIFGLGLVSRQWQGGFEAVFGRFHPADLGLFGVLSIYGAIGVVIMSLVLHVLMPKEIVVHRAFRPTMVLIVCQTVLWGLAYFQLSFVLVCWMLLWVGVRVGPRSTVT